MEVFDVITYGGTRWQVADIVRGWVLLTNNLDRSEWVEVADVRPSAK